MHQTRPVDGEKGLPWDTSMHVIECCVNLTLVGHRKRHGVGPCHHDISDSARFVGPMGWQPAGCWENDVLPIKEDLLIVILA